MRGYVLDEQYRAKRAPRAVHSGVSLKSFARRERSVSPGTARAGTRLFVKDMIPVITRCFSHWSGCPGRSV
jgi:hypothetical protein